MTYLYLIIKSKINLFDIYQIKIKVKYAIRITETQIKVKAIIIDTSIMICADSFAAKTTKKTSKRFKNDKTETTLRKKARNAILILLISKTYSNPSTFAPSHIISGGEKTWL